MNPMEMNKPSSRYEQIGYICRGLLLVHHYIMRGSFVAPGHRNEAPRVFHELQLKLMGAKPVKLQLWPRNYK